MSKLSLIVLMFFQLLYVQEASAQDKKIQDFMQSRRKIIERLQNSFKDDFFADDFSAGSLFDDFDKMLESDLSSTQGQGFEIEEKEVENKIILTIKPKKNAKLDVINNINSLTIKSSITSKENGSVSSSSFSRSISAPLGYKVQGPEAENGVFIITMMPSDNSKLDQGSDASSDKLELIEKVPLQKEDTKDMI